MKITEIEHKGFTIVITEGGCSIIGDGWDLTLPSEKFDRITKEHPGNIELLEEAMIYYKKEFFKQ